MPTFSVRENVGILPATVNYLCGNYTEPRHKCIFTRVKMHLWINHLKVIVTIQASILTPGHAAILAASA